MSKYKDTMPNVYALGEKYALSENEIDRILDYIQNIINEIGNSEVINNDLGFLFLSKMLTASLASISQSIMVETLEDYEIKVEKSVIKDSGVISPKDTERSDKKSELVDLRNFGKSDGRVH